MNSPWMRGTSEWSCAMLCASRWKTSSSGTLNQSAIRYVTDASATARPSQRAPTSATSERPAAAGRLRFGVRGSPMPAVDRSRRASVGSASMRLHRIAAVTAIVGGLAVSAVFTYLAARDVEWHRFRAGLAESDYRWLVPAAATLALGVFLRGVRWRLLFPPGSRPPLGATLRALLVGTFFNNVLPGRPGEGIRVLTLHQETGTSRAAALGTAVAERVLDVVVLLALLFVALPWLPPLSWVGRAAVVAAAVGAVVVVVAIVLALWGRRTLARALRPLVRLPGVGSAALDRAAGDLVDGLAALHRLRVALPALALTTLATLVLACSYWLVTFAFSLDVGFGAGILVMVATNLAMVVPSSPAAIGVFEAATLVALHPYGVDRSEALSYAVVLHALNTLPFIAIGAVLVPRHGVRALRARADRDSRTGRRSRYTF